MLDSISPELALVLPEDQRAAAIRGLPAPQIWTPGPLGERVLPARAARAVVASALLYFGAKLVWTVGTAALYVLAAVLIVVVLTLLF
jgi:hypothetical protein